MLGNTDTDDDDDDDDDDDEDDSWWFTGRSNWAKGTLHAPESAEICRGWAGLSEGCYRKQTQNNHVHSFR